MSERPKLTEISISGIGVIEKSNLEFGPGLTVITGETGAGKTMVLPAPVSPVMTVKPGPNSKLDFSITPIPEMLTSESFGRSLTAPAFDWKFKFRN